MPYMLLILEKRGDRQARPPAEGRAAYESMVAFAGDLKARCLLLAAEALKSDSDAVRVMSRGGRHTIVDGPFAEAKEIVGGFFLLDCATKDQALALAHECPAVEWATVEVRELGPCFEGAEEPMR